MESSTESVWSRSGRRRLKFEELASQLRSQILSGAWTPGTKLPTENELIQESGFSLTTVRRAYESLVDEGLVSRRRGAGTFVNDRRPPRETRQGRVGILIPEAALYYAKVLQGLESTLASRRVSLTLATSNYELDREQEALQSMLADGVRGIIVVPTFRTGQAGENLRRVEALQRLKVPVVLLERSLPELGAADPSEHVVSDHAGGAFDAMQHLLGLGHQRIGLVLRRAPHTAPGIRAGYRTACRADGLEEIVVVEEMEAWNVERADRALEELLEHGCTAALVFGDREAALLESAASRRGLAVPRDLALVSYDDELAEVAEVPLTAMSPAKYPLGSTAAEVMLRRIENGRSSPVLQVKLRPRLVVRESCGAAAIEKAPAV
ncbi:GntR family transcriptional regulator [Brachybacterium vulturis]|uniref:GntR family transcriptional regulator n=1 Tax=Brachybacterium vulturis TaxID=2017484 RepID=A0A291GKS3_9MICO|nr:substrate-binding domain-containing protein [Brachybacterium vulturis]ATG50788.1 GntR family transcriptional regulator [Brachybacterium vulturis]